jgi:hypothetical protein
MRLGLIDLLIAIASTAVGAIAWQFVSPGASPGIQMGGGILIGIGIYLVLIYPVYRGLKLLPMILPRCPCCSQFQQGFHILNGEWPRIRFRCPTCSGEFVIWHNGRPDSSETWECPVLALKWPYALGRYKRMKNPEQGVPPNA